MGFARADFMGCRHLVFGPADQPLAGRRLSLLEQDLEFFAKTIAAGATGAHDRDQALLFQDALGLIQTGSAELGVFDKILFPDEAELSEEAVREADKPQEKSDLAASQGVEEF